MKRYNLDTIKRACFFSAYFIFLFFMVLMLSFYAPYVDFIRLTICYVLIFTKEILNFFDRKFITRREIISFFIAVGLYIFFEYTTNIESSKILLFLLIYSARDIEFREIGRFTLIVSGSLLFVIVAGSLLGIIPNFRFVDAGRVRYYLGFRHSLRGPQLYMNIAFLWIYLRKEAMKIWEFIGLMVINVLLYLFTRSRYAFFSVTLLTLVALILKYTDLASYLDKKNRLSSIFGGGFLMAFPIFAFISISLSYLYTPSSSLMVVLDKVMGQRLRLANTSLMKYGFGLFGKQIPWVGMGLDYKGNFQFSSAKFYNYVDSVYVKSLQGNGLIMFFIIMSLFILASYKVWNKKDLYSYNGIRILGDRRDYYLVFIILILLFHFIFSDQAVGLHYNAMWFLICNVILARSQEAIKTKRRAYELSKRTQC